MKKIIIISILALAGCSENTPPQPFSPPAIPICTADIICKDVPLYFEEMGTITASQIAQIKPQVSGLITGMHFKEGGKVEKGDLLYTIDDTSYAIKVQEAQAALAQNTANLTNCKKKMERYKSLSKPDFIAPVEWDELQTQISLYEAQVQADEAKLTSAKLDLADCLIKAPISGRIGKSSLKTGNSVSVGEVLVTLTQEIPLYVDFAVTEKELLKLPSEHIPLELFSAGGEDSLGSGEVSFLDSAIDSKTGTISARGIITTMSHPLKSGQTVRIHLFYGKKIQATLVPLRAIRINQTGPYIYSVKEDNTVELHSVKLGPEEKEMVVVEEGLEGASKVVTEGHLRLYAGAKVEGAS